MIIRFLCVVFVSSSFASAAIYALRTLEQRWPDVDIIAIVNVGEVHTVTTPERITLQTAEATIEQIMFRRIDTTYQENETKIRIYLLLPNGLYEEGLLLTSGRAFVMMNQKGIDAFFPTDPWEFQPLSTNEILWPTVGGIQKKSIVDVAREIEEHLEVLKNAKKR